MERGSEKRGERNRQRDRGRRKRGGNRGRGERGAYRPPLGNRGRGEGETGRPTEIGKQMEGEGDRGGREGRERQRGRQTERGRGIACAEVIHWRSCVFAKPPVGLIPK